jgi:hypothetical protein
MSQNRICPNCEAELPLNAKFCPQCGTSLETAAVSETLASVEPDAPLALEQPEPYPRNNLESITAEYQVQPENRPVQPVSNIWYVVPVVLGLLIDPLLAIVSGVILYFVFRKKNLTKAKNILIFSFVWSLLMYALDLAITYFFPALA